MRYKQQSALLLVGVFVLVLSGCGKDDNLSTLEPPKENDLENWSYEQVITDPIQVSAGDEDVTLGDRSQHAVSVTLPGGAFDEVTEVSLKTPEEVPGYVSDHMQMIGSPLEIDSSGVKRLNEPMTVTFSMNDAMKADPYEAAFLRLVYYDSEKWDSIKPTKIDEDEGTIEFQLYHFSLLGYSKVDSKVVTENWIQSQSLNNYMSSQTGEISDAVAEKAIDLTLEKMGITDKTIKGAILTDIIKNDTYKDLYDDYQKGDVEGFNQKFSVLLGQKIAERVPNSMLKGALSSLTEGADDVAVVSQAAGYAAEGQYKEAAKMVGEMISDKFLITTAGKIAVEVVQGQIDSWKNEEIDAAYKAYKNGANNRFWGYNVDAGDFDAVWRQMRGIGRQIELEAVKKENDIREEAGMPLLSEKEEEKVRLKVKESMRKQFESRSSGEDKLEHEQEQLKLLVDVFKEAGFLDRSGGPQGLSEKNYTLEMKLDVLHHFAKKMMRETGRNEISDNIGLIMQNKIAADDILLGARYYFSKPDGRKKYAEYIKERWGIDIYPKLSDLSGSWSNGKMVITSVELSESAQQEMEQGTSSDLEGCDLDIDLKSLEGKEAPFVFTIDPSGDAGGTITTNTGEDSKSFPFTYTNGIITATTSEQGASASLTMPVTKEGDRFAINGTMIVNYGDGAVKITAAITASRSK